MNKTMNFYQAMKYLKDNQGAKIVCSIYTRTYYLMFYGDCVYWYIQKSNELNGQLQITKQILDATYTIYEPKNPNKTTFGELKVGEYFEYPIDNRIYRKINQQSYLNKVNAYYVFSLTVANFNDSCEVLRLPDYKE